MKKYSIWELVKARWGKRDLLAYAGCGLFQTTIMYFTGKMTITAIETGVVTELLGLKKFLLCAAGGYTYWTFIYLAFFLLSLAVYKLVVYGARKEHPGYDDTYNSFLEDK